MFEQIIKIFGLSSSVPGDSSQLLLYKNFNFVDNMRQMFWISQAHLSCHKLEENKVEIAEIPSQVSVLMNFSNQLEFAKDFNCPIGSKMNPAAKCEFFQNHLKLAKTKNFINKIVELKACINNFISY